MKYTKENIIGVEFAESYCDKNIYKCLRFNNDSIVMAYLTDLKGYSFENTIKQTLECMNEGKWKDFSDSTDSFKNLIIW